MLEIEREGWLALTDEKRKLLFEMTGNSNWEGNKVVLKR